MVPFALPRECFLYRIETYNAAPISDKLVNPTSLPIVWRTLVSSQGSSQIPTRANSVISSPEMASRTLTY